jgi:uncharacterized protein YlxP (DUF503 family)
MNIGMAKFNFYSTSEIDIKQRRRVATSIRDRIKNKYNASVILVYSESNRSFDIFVSVLSQNIDFINKIFDEIIMHYELESDFILNVEFDIQKLDL